MSGCDSSSVDWRSTWRREWCWWGLYLAIALFASWPLALQPGSAISLGFEAESTVPLLNVWTMWWNSDRLAAGFAGYWNAPIFHPTEGTFAFSEAQPLMVVVAPIIWLTGNKIFAYNVYFWLILSLNGYSSRRLLLRVGHHPFLAFCGGLICQMLPFVWWQSGVVQLTTLFGIVWTIHALMLVFEHSASTESTAETNRRTAMWPLCNGLKLGGAFCVTYLLCNYWGMFLTLLLVPSSLWLWNASLLRWRFWLSIGVAALVSVSILGPLVYVQKSLAGKHQWSRDQSWIRDLSAHQRDYLDAPRTTTFRATLPTSGDVRKATPQTAPPTTEPSTDQVVVDTNDVRQSDWTYFPKWDFPEEARRDIWPLGSGNIRLLLVPIGLLSAFLGRRIRWGLFAVTFGLIAFGLSLGPTVWFVSWMPVLGGTSPFEMLQQYVPGFALIRSPFRFAMFVQLAVAWLSVEFLDLLNPLRWRRSPADPEVHEHKVTPTEIDISETAPPPIHPALLLPPEPWIHPKIMRWIQWGPLVVVSLLVTIEVWPPRQSIYSIPSTAGVPAWVHWLRENSAPDDAVVCLPFPTGYNVRDYEETTVWMYWGTLHRRPLINGYSGFFPKPFVDLKEKLTQFYRPEGTTAAEPQLKMYPWDSPALKDLNQFPLKYLVVKRSFATRDDVWQHPLTKFRWAWVTSDETSQLDIYELIPVDPES